MRCANCTQLTQDSDFVEVVKADDTVMEVCAWCASDLERKNLAQNPSHGHEGGLF